MAGRRSLTKLEERRLLRVVRKLPARDQALITTQWMTGFRISEILSLTVGNVIQGDAIREKIGVAPRFMKGELRISDRVHNWYPEKPLSWLCGKPCIVVQARFS